MGRFLRFGTRVVDLEGRVVWSDHEASQPLTDNEAALLAYLLEHPRGASREALHGQVWRLPGDALSRAADKAVVRLRAKLGDSGRSPRFLLTVFGQGYRLHPDEVWEAASAPEAPRAVGPPGLGEAAAPLAPAGREAQSAALRGALVGGRRLVSLVGPAGSGKTLTARAALAGLVGVRCIEVGLDEAGTTAEVQEAVVRACGGASVETLWTALGAGPTVLLLDGAEQSRTELVSWVHRLLVRCPRVAVVVTSRTVLHMRGEVVLRLA